MFTIENVSGSKLEDFLPDVARLRISVFREYPYLYEGDMEYEKKYLKRYADSPEAVVILARDDAGNVIGASTGNALKYESDSIKKPFIDAKWNVEEVFYFAESVLEIKWRGYGIGKEFMKHREEFARKNPVIKYLAFCSVVREGYKMPEGYNSPEFLWQKSGFKKHPELVCYLGWPDIGETVETEKKLVFWIKKI